jgi:CubicO group peptidase (beta-lactamase class C family)
MDDQHLDARFRTLRPTLRSPGVSAGVLLPAGVHWTAAEGLADIAGGIAMTSATPLRIGSVTKTFTAAAIVLLAERGALDLDDPAVQHLPELRALITNGHSLDAVTVRRLLVHRSGLVSEPPTRDWFTPPYPSIEEILRRIDLAQIVIAPGSAYKYSNLGYALLGEIVARASGQRYESFVQQSLLEPAGLTSTTFETPAEAARGYGRASGGDWVEQAPQEFGGEQAGGGMWSTVADLLRWGEAAMGAAATVLTPETAALLATPQTTDDTVPTPRRSLGWDLTWDDERVLHSHGGGVSGFRCCLAFDASTSTVAVVLTNGHTEPEAACLGLLDIERFTPVPHASASTESAAAANAPSTPPSTEPLGDYDGPLEHTACIERREDGALWLNGDAIDEPAGARLDPRGQDAYLPRAGRYAGETLALERTSDGQVAAFTIAGWHYQRR